MSKYLDPKTLAKISSLELKAKFVVEGFISGMHRSPHKGFSVEFAQHRGYVPGDDLKHLDWRVYAKSGRYCIKQYEAETNLVAHLLLDGSESMAYVSPDAAGKMSKLEYGKLITASLAHLINKQSDAVAVGIFDSEVRSYIERSTRGDHIFRICDTLEKIVPEKKTGVGDILDTFAERIRKRGVVVLISDCFDQVDIILKGIQHLRHRGHEVLVLHLLDPYELSFPFEGCVQFHGLENGPQVLCHPRQLRRAYLQELEKYLVRIKAACQRNNVDYTLINTETPPDVVLSAYLHARERMMASGAARGVRL